MNTTDWFVGSASRAINPDPVERAGHATFAHVGTPLMVHAVGFRGEDCLLALVVCDIEHPERIDISSLTFHINLHPITPVEVILVASGTRRSPDYGSTSATYQHQVVHAITDCVIDALTFGCPAQMRVTPHAIQWRKFDEQPIATVALHGAGTRLSDADLTACITQWQAPVLHVTQAVDHGDVTLAQMFADITSAATAPVTQVAWQHDGQRWLVTINDTQLHVVPDRQPLSNGMHTIAIDPAETHNE
jgi:hypothetical protein